MRADAEQSMLWWWDPRAWPLVMSGVLLIVSGVVHLLVWAIDGGPWEGPVTWRKPILFGISGGLTAISAGWAFAKLPRRRWDRLLAWSTAVTLTVEVALIDLQRWRGVASHFNRETPLDSFLYDAMGGLIVWVTLVSADLMLRFFRSQVGLPADMLLAARSGLVALVWSCVLGIWVSVHGDMQMMAGMQPERFGAAGVPKFAHGAVIHALQWLPMLAWAGRRAGIEERQRVRLLAAASLGTFLLAAYALLQTVAGRPRVDGSPPLVVLAVAAAGLLLWPTAVTLVRLVAGRRRQSPA
ncbi:MAG: hypothetical protein ISQ70_02925 [Pirellulales bacterium]|nr:hypothetical protein [Pirellulales bacterium]